MKNALVIIAVAFLFCLTLMAQDTEASRNSMKGLTGVEMGVEDLKPDVERDGLSRDQIQTDVELRLRVTGIKVLTREQRLATPGMPVLVVSLNTLKMQGAYLYSIHIDLRQMVRLGRDPQISGSNVSTWSVGGLGFAGVANLDQVRNDIKDAVDRFINAWLSVNPKY